jgi:hypothetical protein
LKKKTDENINAKVINVEVNKNKGIENNTFKNIFCYKKATEKEF